MFGFFEDQDVVKKKKKEEEKEKNRMRDKQFIQTLTEIRARNGQIAPFGGGGQTNQRSKPLTNERKQENDILKEYQRTQKEFQMKSYHKVGGLKQPVTNEFIRQRAVSRYNEKQQPQTTEAEQNREREQDALAL